MDLIWETIFIAFLPVLSFALKSVAKPMAKATIRGWEDMRY